MMICKEHIKNENETSLTPNRYKCKICKKKTIHGYSNPDHVSNPFGYLHLAPMVCDNCAKKENICRWCEPNLS